MVSPAGSKARLVPLSIAREINRKHILLFIFNGFQNEAQQMQLYLQYITFYHAANLTAEEKDQAVQLSTLFTEMGYDPPTLSNEILKAEQDQKLYETQKRKDRNVWVRSTKKKFRVLIERAINYADRVSKCASEITQVSYILWILEFYYEILIQDC